MDLLFVFLFCVCMGRVELGEGFGGNGDHRP